MEKVKVVKIISDENGDYPFLVNRIADVCSGEELGTYIVWQREGGWLTEVLVSDCEEMKDSISLIGGNAYFTNDLDIAFIEGCVEKILNAKPTPTFSARHFAQEILKRLEVIKYSTG